MRLELGQPLIEIGKPLTLKCRMGHKININLTRQWTGGQQNRLLCFNGVTIDPVKYKEEFHLPDTFTLRINETTETDLDCAYSCRLGFESDEKILTVTEQNFLCKYESIFFLIMIIHLKVPGHLYG